MLLSLIKKITSSSSNEAQTNTHNTTTQTTQVVKPEKEEFCDEVNLVNLPSWKDKSIWNQTELKPEIAKQCQEIQETITDLLRTIKDPEKPNSLDDLNVILEDSVKVLPLGGGDGYLVRIDFHPTVPHCSLASLIGLCLRNKIKRDVVDRIKLDIVIAEGKHSTEEEINKQINDKERVAAAMENPNLKEIVNTCIKDDE